jgi:hypothetical protein
VLIKERACQVSSYVGADMALEMERASPVDIAQLGGVESDHLTNELWP